MRPEIRRRILKRGGYKCAKCNSTLRLEIDHIIPISKGGREDEDNMQVLCKTCNLKKGNKIDYTQYFIIDKSPEYIEVARAFGELTLSAQEIANIFDCIFKLHAQYWRAKGIECEY